MCSIGGFISSQPIARHTAKNLLSALVWYGQDRGTQSAGCYYNGRLAKKAIHPGDFLESSDYFNLFDRDGTLGLTHTRIPTSGAHGDDQAQPFQIGRTVSIHNGMFWDTASLKKEWSVTKPSGVDSELITSLVHSLGPYKLPDFIESTDGPSAIAAVHNDKLFLLRAGNPTWYYHLTIEGGTQVMIFASTQEQLISSMRHAWLLSDPIRAQGTEQFVLLQATASKLLKASRKIKAPFGSGAYDSCYAGYGVHSYGDEGAGWRKYLYEQTAGASERIKLAAGTKWEGE